MPGDYINKQYTKDFLARECAIIVLLGASALLQWINIKYVVWVYSLAVLIAVCSGIIHVKALNRLFSIETPGFFAKALALTVLLVLFISLFTAILYFIFRLNINFLTFQVGFIVPFFTYHAYHYFIQIPPKSQKVQHSHLKEKKEKTDAILPPGRKVLKLILSKNPVSRSETLFTVEAPDDVPVKELFFNFINEYNRTNVSNTILNSNGDGASFRWLFFIKKGWLGKKLFIEPGWPVGKTGITADQVIYAVRDFGSAVFSNRPFNTAHPISTTEVRHPLVKTAVFWLATTAVIAGIIFVISKLSIVDRSETAQVRDGEQMASPQPVFKVIRPAGENLIIIQNLKTNLYGYARAEDTSLFISFKYEQANPFNQGLALVKQNNKYRWIRSDSTDAFPGQYDLAENFKAGKAKVTNGNETFYIDTYGVRQQDVVQRDNSRGHLNDSRGGSNSEGRDDANGTRDIEPPPVIKMCTVTCDTKGITGVEVSFTDHRTSKKYKSVSSGDDLEFNVPCYLLDEAVSVKFSKNGESDSRNFRLKDLEIPEKFKN